MPHLFISYSKKDTRELALSLADMLNSIDGVTAWVDRSLRAGRSWELQIQSEIDRCDSMIVLYSPDINRHKQGEPESYVLTEIAYAKYTARKPIIPVMAQPTDPPMSLTREHYIDFTLSDLTLNDLLEELQRELAIAPLPVTTALPKTPQPDPTQRLFEMMPPPFDLMTIPGGHVTIEEKVLTVPEFQIGKYPVTNAQYAKFMEAGGYKEKKWWTEAGWQQKQKDEWNEPRYWNDKIWNVADYPVVGVSWYEAVAFCQWLADVTGNNIMLPSEAHWQRAAQGDDGRVYPWNNEWDCQQCNNSVKPCASDRTTPVKQYEGKGDSPFGVVDMVGNVWEWCLTDYEQQTDDVNSNAKYRVLRGGSWFNFHAGYFRCDYRLRFHPHYWGDPWGFRFALS